MYTYIEPTGIYSLPGSKRFFPVSSYSAGQSEPSIGVTAWESGLYITILYARDLPTGHHPDSIPAALLLLVSLPIVMESSMTPCRSL